MAFWLALGLICWISSGAFAKPAQGIGKSPFGSSAASLLIIFLLLGVGCFFCIIGLLSGLPPTP